MQRCRMCSTFKLLVVTVVVISIAIGNGASAMTPAAAAGLFLLGQVVNDQRQTPTDINTISLNVAFNARINGKFIGANPDPRVIVAAVKQGVTLEWLPGNMGRRTVVGFEVVSSAPGTPAKQGIYWCEFADKHEEAYLGVGKNTKFNGNPLYYKWMIPIETAGLPDGLHTFTIRVWFMEPQMNGFLKLKKKEQVRREEIVCKVLVLNPEYYQQAVNDLEVQDALRNSFGLMGGPPQIGQRVYQIDPQVANTLNAGIPQGPGVIVQQGGQVNEPVLTQPVPVQPEPIQEYQQTPVMPENAEPQYEPAENHPQERIEQVTLSIFGKVNGRSAVQRLTVTVNMDKILRHCHNKKGNAWLRFTRNGEIVLDGKITLVKTGVINVKVPNGGLYRRVLRGDTFQLH